MPGGGGYGLGTAGKFDDEKLIVAILYSDPKYLEGALELLAADLGPVDLMSDAYAFSDGFSSYYDEELGGKAIRRLCCFENCLDPSRLADIKRRTNDFEVRLSTGGKRRVNLDPGLLSHGRLVLASTKNAEHRIALSGGIYAELTLFYARKRWNAFPWTYRDFQTETVLKFLSEVRDIYIRQRRQWLVT